MDKQGIYPFTASVIQLTSIVAVSCNSTRNVLWPAIMWSLAPILTKTWSTGVKSNSAAGTSAPTCFNQSLVRASHRFQTSCNSLGWIEKRIFLARWNYFLLKAVGKIEHQVDTWARITARHTWRRRVDFPPIFGPVNRMNGACFSPPSAISLGTKEFPPARVPPIVGWRRLLALNHGTSCPDWENLGVQVAPSAYKPAADMLISTSTSAYVQDH